MTHRLADVLEIDVPRNPLQQPAEVLRALYRQQGEKIRRKITRQGLWVAVFVHLLFSLTDILLIPDAAAITVVTRFVISAMMLASLELLVWRNAGADAIDRVSAAALVAAYAGWLFTALQTSNTEVMSYYMVFGAIFMMSVNLFFSFAFRLSLIASGVIVVLFIAGLYGLPTQGVGYKLTFGIFCISCFIFTSYVNWKLNQERFNVFLNALEAKAQQKEATERGQQLLRLSHTDPLTGLENRRAIDQRLRDLWDRWQHAGEAFAAILVDVDFFKRYNDCYGHQEGDRCLTIVADALRDLAEMRQATIGRYGGEEFIILAKLDEEAELAGLAEAIRQVVERLELRHEQRRDGISIVTVSVGAAFTRHHAAAKLEKVIYEADRALYASKAAGRNCVRLFDPNDPQTSDDREHVAAVLKIAVPQHLVSMVYQPLQDVGSGEVSAVESLMRLRMPDGGLIPPSLFIPIAERTGTILSLGQWAIQTVCHDVLAPNLMQIASVNVSPLQLRSPGFAAFVALTLHEAGITGDRLALEITEGQDMEMHSGACRCINDLKALGVKIWLDDFGTGFAGLSWLRLVEFDCVKIDKSFVHDSHTPRGRAMLEDIIRLVRNRQATILAEGVETPEQASLMKRLGIDLVQGYHLGRPMTASALKRSDRGATSARALSAL
ncbi:putative bifunctional diguanylate cyclase/phosphodiesterase [Rhizobium halophilum]|uniref:putative bifunctional diguanylate cyclase/phosphodiesterase n=1 Tax=Rhizobium halophilum TaxID=2846852 RepID=UPI001EFD12AD|nr:EAL domain-containing protein [Rhizobium halophilum]MCF6370509.1 EAL domain-containing protein [Rhizobium halophilum]